MTARNTASELQINRNSSYEIKAVSSESVTVPSGAAGTVVVAQLANFPVRNSAGSDIGGLGDTSLALTGVSVPFTNEVAYKTADADLENGDYWVDYIRGAIRGKKETTATSATAAYKIAIQNISLDEAEVTVNVDGTDLASGAKQDTGNASLSSIDSKASTIIGHVDGIEGSLSTLVTQTDAVESSLSTLVTQTDGLEGQLNNLLNGQAKTFTPSNASVTTSSAEVLASNNSRKTGTTIKNVSTAGQRISLSVGGTAVLDSGITLYPGEFWQMDEHDFTSGSIRAISSAASGSLAITELT